MTGVQTCALPILSAAQSPETFRDGLLKVIDIESKNAGVKRFATIELPSGRFEEVFGTAIIGVVVWNDAARKTAAASQIFSDLKIPRLEFAPDSPIHQSLRGDMTEFQFQNTLIIFFEE